MQAKVIDITGQRFGRLTVKGYGGTRRSKGGQSKTQWDCICDCGTAVRVDGGPLKGGKIQSCKCLQSELHIKRATTHGMTRTKEYRAWSHAKDRCHRKSDPKFPIYGGRGLVMCDLWRGSYAEFFKHMGLCPNPLWTLERKNPDDGYNPDNCCWASRTTQANNIRGLPKFDFRGRRMTIAEIAREEGIKKCTLWSRVNKQGMTVEVALAKPI